jgi:hypothetical protein
MVHQIVLSLLSPSEKHESGGNNVVLRKNAIKPTELAPGK